MEGRDLGLLLTLDAVLQEGSVTGAARRLGLSVPAVSHALARLRDQLQDPLLVRAGRSMVLTPRAEALRPRLRDLVDEATRALSPDRPFSPRTLERGFTVLATDHVLMVLGPALDRILAAEAPRVCIRYLPSTLEDAAMLRDGSADLAVCLLGHFPAEIRTRRLFTDRFVVALRRGHPAAQGRLGLEAYLALDHVVVAPLGRSSHVDLVLEEQGLARRIRRVVPYFGSGLEIAARTDMALTASDRAAQARAGDLGLVLLPPPLVLSPYALNLVWHPRLEDDAANAWLREAFLRAAAETAPDAEPAAKGDLGIRRPRRRTLQKSKA